MCDVGRVGAHALEAGVGANGLKNQWAVGERGSRGQTVVDIMWLARGHVGMCDQYE